MDNETTLILSAKKSVQTFHQCKEIEENKRMGKTRNLFKKIRGTKRTCHAKMGTIKDRNVKNTQKVKVKVKLCPTLCDPWTVAYQAPPSMGFSRQEY